MTVDVLEPSEVANNAEIISETLMSKIYKLDKADGTTVAFKVCRDPMLENELVNEGQLMEHFNSPDGSVETPGLLPGVMREIKIGGITKLGIEMPLLRENSFLDKQIGKNGMEIDKATKILSSIAKGLDVMDAEGVTHNDIKTQNIVVDNNGEGVLTDFGISDIEAVRQRVGGTTFLSPQNCAPEAVTHKKVVDIMEDGTEIERRVYPELDGRSDQYSLATVAVKMLSGEDIYQVNDSDVMQALSDKLFSNGFKAFPAPEGKDPKTYDERAKRLADREKAFRAKLEDKGISNTDKVVMVLNKAMSKNREKRYDTSEEFVKELKAALNSGQE